MHLLKAFHLFSSFKVVNFLNRMFYYNKLVIMYLYLYRMAHSPITIRRQRWICNICIMCTMAVAQVVIFAMWYHITLLYLVNKKWQLTSSKEKRAKRMLYMFRLVKESDTGCKSKLQMDRRTFGLLYENLFVIPYG